MAIFAAPAVLLLTLTLPVVVTPHHEHHRPEVPEGRLVDVDPERSQESLIEQAEEEVGNVFHELSFNKWLGAVQCVLGPLFCCAVLFGQRRHAVWFYLATTIIGVSAAVLMMVFADEGKNPVGRMLRCSMGFAVSMVWIMAIADEVVQVLQTMGYIFGLSDAIIGLTIFAVGNSIADFVADFTVAQYAPIMGFSACFGGPMLNILLGIGISGSVVIGQSGQGYPLKFSRTLQVSSTGLLILLVSTLIFVPWNGYFLSRRWGAALILFYVLLMAINVIVEVKF
jgi:sodium/potassium/calcium exchanger 6